jgi:RNA polymerase sigma factor (sigma-70 family)
MQPGHDRALLRQYLENHSDEAFAALVARHVNLVYSVALRSVVDPHQAEEITQAVFIILAKKALRLRHDKALSSWLFQTTRLTANNYLRSEARRHGREQEAYMQSRLDEPGSDEAWPQIAALLDAAVAALREKDRRAIVLRFYEGRNLREVGDALGGSEESAKKRVARALEKLQRFFSKRGVHSTTAAIAGAISGNAVCVAPPALVELAIASATAKGVAGSLSTLALVKGALKIMAWTNTKNAAVAGGWILLVALLGFIGFDAFDAWRAAHYPDLAGVWEGNMLLDDDGIGANEAPRTHMVLTLVKTNGGYTAITDLVELGRRGIRLGNVAYHYPYLRIEGCPMNVYQNPPGTWKLRVNADATQMILDHWIGFNQSAPILFLRTSTPDPVAAPLAEAEFVPRAGSELQGYWEGEFAFETNEAAWFGTNAVPVTLKVADQGNGMFRADIGWPEFGVDSLPVTGRYQGTLVNFTDDISHGLFQGAVSADDTELIGSWTQGGKSAPASFRRADFRAEHAWDDEKDYSFSSPNDLQGHWKASLARTIAKKRMNIAIALDIAKMPDGSYFTTMSYTNLFENNDPIPCSGFVYHPPGLSVKWKWMKAGYEGTFKNGKLTGEWHQGQGVYPLTFERTMTQ